MSKARSQSQMTVECPFNGHRTDVRWQETDILVGIGRCVYRWCPDCQITHYHIVQ